MPKPPDGLAAALREYQAGRAKEAERMVRRMSRREQEQSGAQYLLGMIALQASRASEAVQSLRRAVAAEPANHVFRSSLAIALRGSGELKEALRELERAIELKPDYVTGLTNLGVMQLEVGQAEAASGSYQRAVSLAPTNVAARFGLGNVHREAGRAGMAAECYRAVIRLDPGHVEAHNNLGNALAAAEDWEGALAALARACELRPADVRLRLNHAAKLEAVGRRQDAIAVLDRTLAAAPENEEALIARLRAAWRMADATAANALIERLQRGSGNTARTWAEIAYLLEAQHRLADARAAVERALAIDPASADALLVQAKIDRRSGDLAAARRNYEAVLARAEMSEAANELGQLHDELGEADAAMAMFKRAKAAYGAQPDAKRSNPRAYLDLVRDIRAYIELADIAHWPSEVNGDERPAPIFFVGFPRSGTTLMEQMLASHPAIITTEEQPLLAALRSSTARLSPSHSPYPRSLEDLPAAALVQLRARYWAGVDRRAGGATGNRRFVDKLPLNIAHLALVRRVFPDAPVLVALRDPRDVVLSCYMQAFQPNDAMANFLTLEGAARLYVEVMALWRVYRARLGLDIHQYRYEDLIAAPRDVLDGIVAFLKIEWSDAMLNHSSRAPPTLVRTPSYQGVARPLNDRAVGRWRRYRRYLKGIEALLAPYVAEFGYPPD